eukprot:7305002-Prymnesium_polylepis.2
MAAEQIVHTASAELVAAWKNEAIVDLLQTDQARLSRHSRSRTRVRHDKVASRTPRTNLTQYMGNPGFSDRILST